MTLKEQEERGFELILSVTKKLEEINNFLKPVGRITKVKKITPSVGGTITEIKLMFENNKLISDFPPIPIY